MKYEILKLRYIFIVQHRQRVKDYRQKLIKEEKTDICAEEDLFNRLDELELQEEMEDEMWRLRTFTIIIYLYCYYELLLFYNLSLHL